MRGKAWPGLRCLEGCRILCTAHGTTPRNTTDFLGRFWDVRRNRAQRSTEQEVIAGHFSPFFFTRCTYIQCAVVLS